MKPKYSGGSILIGIFLVLNAVSVSAALDISGRLKEGLQGITSILGAILNVMGAAENKYIFIKVGIIVVLSILYYIVFSKILKKHSDAFEGGASSTNKPALAVAIIIAILSTVFIPDAILKIYESMFMIATSMLLVVLHIYLMLKKIKGKERFDYFLKLLISLIALVVVAGIVSLSSMDSGLKSIFEFYYIYLLLAIAYYLFRFLIPSGSVRSAEISGAADLMRGAGSVAYDTAKNVKDTLLEWNMARGIKNDLEKLSKMSMADEARIVDFFNKVKEIFGYTSFCQRDVNYKINIIKWANSQIITVRAFLMDPKKREQEENIIKNLQNLAVMIPRQLDLVKRLYEKTVTIAKNTPWEKDINKRADEFPNSAGILYEALQLIDRNIKAYNKEIKEISQQAADILTAIFNKLTNFNNFYISLSQSMAGGASPIGRNPPGEEFNEIIKEIDIIINIFYLKRRAINDMEILSDKLEKGSAMLLSNEQGAQKDLTEIKRWVEQQQKAGKYGKEGQSGGESGYSRGGLVLERTLK